MQGSRGAGRLGLFSILGACVTTGVRGPGGQNRDWTSECTGRRSSHSTTSCDLYESTL